MIRLRYFASLRETLGIGDEQLELPAGIRDVGGLCEWLRGRGDNWNSALTSRQLHVAVNQVITSHDAAIEDGDEVAWFPPVTGG